VTVLDKLPQSTVKFFQLHLNNVDTLVHYLAKTTSSCFQQTEMEQCECLPLNSTASNPRSCRSCRL